MKIGIISDSHDHLPNLRHALTQLDTLGARVVIHCGDMAAPFITLELGRFPGQVHTVFGNNDGDRFLAQQIAAQRTPNVTHHGEAALLELDGRRIAVAHYRAHAIGCALAQQAAVALHGHTHEHELSSEDGRLVINPGELLGMQGRPSFCIYDSESGQAERCVFEPQPWPRGGARWS